MATLPEIAMYERFTDRARKVMQLANQEAQRFNHEYIGTEHMLLGLVQEGSGVAANVLKNLDIDLRKVRREVEKIVQTGPGGDQLALGKLPQTPRAKKVIDSAIEEARRLNHNYVGTEHLLLGLLREEEGVAAQVLINVGLNLADVRAEVLNLLGGPSGKQAEAPTKRSSTPALDALGRDLTDQARLGKLAPLIGRSAELRAVMEVLGSRARPSPLLMGEAGVGKRTLAAGLADAIVRGRVPPWLRGHRVVELRVARAWARSRNWKSAADRLREAFGEARRAPNVILFLPDVVATLWVAGRELVSRGGHAEVFLAIRDGRCPCILAATPADYARCVERWGPLEPAVQPVPVRPATVEETLAVLAGVRERYETFHRVRVDGPALPAIATAADRLPGALPGKAVQILDRCAARTRLRAWEQTPEADLAVVDLDQQIERLNREKEDAVANQDFEKGAALRDQADQLKRQRERLVAERQVPRPVVDVATVDDVVRDLTRPE
jgi:ATP-dependent Clp protease ATP-binding subunit ClpC